MNQAQFDALAAEGYNRIPLVREILADLDTPLSTYLKLAEGPYSCLFESVQGGEKWGRYSIIGLPARRVVTVRDRQVELRCDGVVEQQFEVADPLAWIEEFHASFQVAPPAGIPQAPRFLGGLIGYFGYDTVRYIEPKLEQSPNLDTIGAPDILFMVADEVLVLDSLAGRLYLVVHADPGEPEAFAQGQARLQQLSQQLRSAGSVYQSARPSRGLAEAAITHSFTQAEFEQAVEQIKAYIADGEAMQVVPSQRMSAPYQASPLDLYRALRCTNPSPYMFFMNLDEFYVVGSSPEILVRLEDGEVTVRPLAGTRRRGANEAEDQALEAELLADPKEVAEHLMLIDLARNDIGRVSETGSVRVTEQMAIERYSHVMHIVSNVTGRIRPELTLIDALRATFPAGTLSGAPKIRAMQIIDEVEPVKRGIYGGAVGYLSYSGNMALAIAIRTAVLTDSVLHVQAGAGSVADSEPELEWQETLSKGRALWRAVELAESGLDNPVED